jgi:hypothetical protein
MALKEDYLDDILDTSVNEKRKYRMINNADGTISLEDVTEYSQNGDNFGAFDINITNKTVNELIAMGLNVRCNLDGYLEVLVDGVWEESDLKALDPKTYLYKKGVFNTDIVSGWNVNDYIHSVQYANGANSVKPTLTLNDKTFTLSSYCSDTEYGGGGMYATNDSLDLSNYSSLNIKIPNFTQGTSKNYIIFMATNELQQHYNTSAILARQDISNVGTYSIDISSVNEDCYIGIAVISKGETITFDVSDIWLE